ncbi:MAG TPA: methionyl-tRNA formyltransferase [Alphaproteobacteria bacterium]|nr:methionyl-tRNA formyltransferase [Alphaproteobacteria bacterium]
MTTSPQNIIFMGSPAFAVPSLRLLASQFNIVAVYTQPPRPAGRGQELQKTAVHTLADELGLNVYHPEKLKGDALDTLMGIDCDVLAVVAYGLLLPRTLVESRLCLNLHPSALPRWRGAAPLQHTLLSGDAETDICIMRLDAGMDTGPVYSRTPLAVPPNMTYGELHDTCAGLGAEQLAAVLHQLPGLQPEPQSGEATHAFKLTAEHRAINWSRSAESIHNQIRAFSPAPGATALFEGEQLKVQGSAVIASGGAPTPGEVLHLDADGLTIACGSGAIHLSQLQRPGKKMLPVAQVAQGWPALQPGSQFTSILPE